MRVRLMSKPLDHSVLLYLNFRAQASMHALPECSAALSVKLGKRPDQKREGEFSNRHELEPTTRLRALRSADNSSIPECLPFFHKSCSKARRGFELRLPDSESGVLTVTPPGQMPLSGKQGQEQQD